MLENIKVIHSYFEALENRDIAYLNSIIDQHCNYRTVEKKSLYGKNEMMNYFKKLDETNHIVLKDVKKTKDQIIVTWFRNELSICSKFEFMNNLIVKVVDELMESELRRIKCLISYDGTQYKGYQKQHNQLTVQGVIEDVLYRITKEKITIHSSGRTDKGVHAIGQVFHFDTTSKILVCDWMQVLNNFLPSTIYVKSVEEVDRCFHARYDVLLKEYRYVINTKEYDVFLNNYQWFVEIDDLNRIKKELKSIEGTHDFAKLSKKGEQSDTVREIVSTTVLEEDGALTISIVGKGFLRYMVRKIIGNVVDIANGKNSFTLLDIINSDIYLSNSIAPANGLYLFSVTYK